ncbi:MAG: hypothetical protein ACKVP2_07650 [Burkholderiales bacterium]
MAGGGRRSQSGLGTSDLQSLADLNNGVNIERDRRLVPARRRLLLILATAAVLLLLKYPVAALAWKFFNTYFIL